MPPDVAPAAAQYVTSHRKVVLVASGATALAGVALAWWCFSLHDVTALDAEAIASRVRDAGPWGAVALLGLLLLQCIVAPLPSEPLMMAAGFIYGTPAGFTLGWAGVVTGALLCFGIARVFGRPLVARLVGAPRLASVETLVAERGLAPAFFALLAVRALAFASFDVVSYVCGLVRFPFRWFVLATALGAVPKVLAFTYVGTTMGSPPVWLNGVILAGTFGVIAAAAWIARHVRRKDVR